ncbi:MAG: hypothetical protein FJ146_17135 [Deltaproteobacteria bacterium]|nr:hypothetical protein [Deltaproteobacteria bacterium]
MLASTKLNIQKIVAAGFMMISLGSSIALAEVNADPKAYFQPWAFGQHSINVDGKIYSENIFESGIGDAAHAFDSNPAAANRFNEYLSEKKLSTYLFWGSIASAIALNVADARHLHLPQRERDIAFGALIYGGLAGSLYFSSKSALSLGKAMNIYNGHERANTINSRSLDLTIAPFAMSRSTGSGTSSGAGLSFELNF